MYLRVRLTSTALRSREVRSRPRWKDAWGSKCDSDVKVVGLGLERLRCDEETGEEPASRRSLFRHGGRVASSRRRALCAKSPPPPPLF